MAAKKNEAVAEITETENAGEGYWMNVRITFAEPVLGSSPNDKEIYSNFIASKAPDAKDTSDEIEAVGVDGVIEKGKTVFPRFTKGRHEGEPFMWDYQWKGFFKGSCGFLRGVLGTEASKVKAYKKKIDGLIFVYPRRIPFMPIDGDDKIMVFDCQRPLRAQTAQGERVALANSEEIPAGTRCEFRVNYLNKGDKKLVGELLSFGIKSGFGQWHNSGMGRFFWEELDENGNVIGGNFDDNFFEGDY